MFGDDQSAIGRHFLGGDKTHYQIVGVVENGKYEMLTEDPSPAMFFPLAQATEANTTLSCVPSLPPAEIASALNRMLTGIDSSLPFTFAPGRLALPGALPRRALPQRLSASWDFSRQCWPSPASSAWPPIPFRNACANSESASLSVRIAVNSCAAALGRPLLVLALRIAGRPGAGRARQPPARGLVYEATPRTRWYCRGRAAMT